VTNPIKVEKLQTDFKALTSVSASLNTASDELAKAVSVLDEALKKLNIGLTVWVTFRSWSSERDEYDEEQIGYCKLAGKWGIALRRIWGDINFEQRAEDGPWVFNDGPREMRLAGVDKFPELIEALNKEASNATKKIQEKTQEVRELASVIEHPGKPPAPPAPIVSPKAAPQKPPAPPAPLNATQPGPLKPPAPPNANTISPNDMLGQSNKGSQ
jgi:hypothetical protein